MHPTFNHRICCLKRHMMYCSVSKPSVSYSWYRSIYTGNKSIVSNLPTNRLCLRVEFPQVNRNFSTNNKFLSFINMASRLLGLVSGDVLKNSKSILFNCQDQAKNQSWYTKGLVADSFRSRHTLMMLHIWMVHKRLILENKPGKLIQESLFDEFWVDTSSRLRGQGIAELSINKHLKEMQSFSFKFALELDQALTMSTETEILDELAGVLWRFVYNRDESIPEDHVLDLARYIRSEQLSLIDLPQYAIFQGRIEWSKLPWDSSKPRGRNRKVKFSPEALSPSTDELNSDDNNITLTEEEAPKTSLWKEATADDGRVYYWNIKTRESRWEKPKE